MAVNIKIHVLHCGKVRVDRSLPFHEKTWVPFSYTGIFRSNKYQIWLPVSTYLIEHPKGLVLIDTGWHTDVRVNQKKHLGLFHYIINKANLPAGKAIHEQLETRGIQPSDIDFLVLSHLHSDHASGLKHLKSAKKIMVSDLEWQAFLNDKKRYIPSMWNGVAIEKFSYSNADYGPQRLAFDLFGDDSVVFVNTPGHTPGLSSTLIQSEKKAVLLCSDVGYAAKSWKQMIMPGVMVNRKQCRESLRWVKNMSEQENLLEVLANHDPAVLPHTIEL